MAGSMRLQAGILSVFLLALFIAVWHLGTLTKAGTQVVDAEYAKLVGQHLGLPGLHRAGAVPYLVFRQDISLKNKRKKFGKTFIRC
jgi:hypothetical protein